MTRKAVHRIAHRTAGRIQEGYILQRVDYYRMVALRRMDVLRSKGCRDLDPPKGGNLVPPKDCNLDPSKDCNLDPLEDYKIDLLEDGCLYCTGCRLAGEDIHLMDYTQTAHWMHWS